MNNKTAHALLVHLTAQTEFLGLIAHYYATQDERDLVRALPARTVHELRTANPEAAALAERMGASSRPQDEFTGTKAA